jgi:hypothetical protein
MKTEYFNANTNEPIKVYQRKATGRMVPCDGPAHSNAHIDHCAKCAPKWGEVPEYAPTDLDEARRDGLVVLGRNAPDDLIEHPEKYGAVRIDVLRRDGKRSHCYMVGFAFGK